MRQEKSGDTAVKKKARGHVLKAERAVSTSESCCESENEHPDHSYAFPRIRRIQGQIAGVEKMIQDRRYCPDILIQTRAVYSAVRALEATILETHVRACVRSAMLSRNEKDVNRKVTELVGLFLNKP